MHHSMVQTYIGAIADALDLVLEQGNVLVFGLGVTDPRGIFGSTLGLEEKYGSDRVFDVPLSENAMTGVAIGFALGGFRPVFVHQRFDFFLLAMDQLVNSAAKWHMMFGGKSSLPIVFRLVVGRGWGQGPTHSQSLHSWLAHIPGLKVVMPFTAQDAKGLLMAAVQDNNPVVFIEHRWLHNSEGYFPSGSYTAELGKSRVLRSGEDFTIIAVSLANTEALRAAKFLDEYFDISLEVVDLISIRPIDWETIHQSVKKTRGLVVLDISHAIASVASEIVANVAQTCFSNLDYPPIRICNPDFSTPTSHYLAEDYYPDASIIVDKICQTLNLPRDAAPKLKRNEPADIPGDWFSGPF